MTWPVSQDFNEAIQAPQASFQDPELRAGQPATNALGLPMPRAGNFADVYEFHCPATQSRWAIKCFTRSVPRLRERYGEISRYLQQAKLPFMVGFAFLEQGIRVRSQWYPIVKMQWVEGLLLNQFVRASLDRPAQLEALSQIWLRMARRLREAGVAHCDLQHGNVLLVPGSKATSLGVRLVDYDGLFVPTLSSSKSGEIGHPAYQHPQRLLEGTYSLEVDRFPLLVIATALRCLSVAGPALWTRYDNGDNLLFREADLGSPAESALFKELWQLDEPLAHALVGHLALATRAPLEQAPLLEQLLTPGSRPALPGRQEEQVTRLLGVSRVSRRTVTVPVAEPVLDPELDFGQITAGSGGAGKPRRARERKRGIALAVELTAVAVALVSLATGAYFVATAPGPEKPAEPPVAKQPAAPPEPPHPVEEPNNPPPITKKNREPEKPAVGTVVRRPEVVGEVQRYLGPQADVRRVAFAVNRNQALAACWDQKVRLVDLDSRLTVQQFEGHTQPLVNAAVFCPDGRRVLSAGSDRVLRLWDLRSGLELRQFQGHENVITCLALSPDGRVAATGGPEAAVFLWGVETGRLLRRLEGHNTGTASLAFVRRGNYLVGGGEDGVIRLWDVASGNMIRQYRGHTGRVGSLTPTPEGRYLLSAGADATIRLWNLETSSQLRRYDGHSGEVSTVDFSRTRGQLLSAGADETIRLWDVDSGKEVHRFDKVGTRIWDIAFSANGRYALSGGADQTLRLWLLPPPAARAARELNLVAPRRTATDRLPEPDNQELAVVLKEIDATYKVTDTPRSRPTELRDLSDQLLRQGMAARAEPARRFGFLTRARELAASAGEPDRAVEAVIELTRHFDVNGVPLKAEALERVSRSRPTVAAQGALLRQALLVFDEAIAVDDYKLAKQLLQLAQTTSRTLRPPPFGEAIRLRQGQLDHLEGEYRRLRPIVLRLDKNPNDPRANVEMGKFECFQKGEWARGLPMFVLGNDNSLASLAEKELDRPTDPGLQAKLGEDWLDYAPDARTFRSRAAERANFWFRTALPGLSGSEKAQAEERLKRVIGGVEYRPGLVVELFRDEEFKQKVKTRVDYQVDFNWGEGPPDPEVPADHFSIRWRGWLLPPRPGRYRLIVEADDGCRLFLNNDLKLPVIDSWTKVGRAEKTVTLSSIPHHLVLECHETTGLARMHFRWLPEGEVIDQPVPPEVLYHDRKQEQRMMQTVER
jgi:WD40 repeat protein